MTILRFNRARNAEPADEAKSFGLSHRAYLQALRIGDDQTIVARSADRARARRWLDKWMARSPA